MFNENQLINNQTKCAKNIAESEFYHFIINDIFDRLDSIDKQFQETLLIGNEYVSSSHFRENNTTFCPNHLSIPNYTQKFDLIIFPFMLHFVSNIEIFLKEVHRILDETGIFICNFAGEGSLKELRSLFIQIESETNSPHSPHITPFIRLASVPELLNHTDFEENISDMESIEVEYDSPVDLMYAIKDMGQTNILMNKSSYAINKRMYKLLKTKYHKQFKDKINLITFVASKRKNTIQMRRW